MEARQMTGAQRAAIEHVQRYYGYCDRHTVAKNDCYWGRGTHHGCLYAGWLGILCKHWHPVEGDALAALVEFHTINDGW